MSIITRFAGQYNALSFNYGGSNADAPNAIQILSGNTATGAGTVYASAPFTVDQGSNPFNPFAVGQQITIGLGANQETVTLTAVGAVSLAGFSPGNYAIPLTATFSFVHGPQDEIFSSTYGLQEALNVAAANAGATSGGVVLVNAGWYQAGGTVAMIQAAVVPTNGGVQILDTLNKVLYGQSSASVSLVAAPSAPTSSTVASLSSTGTWTAVTTYVKFMYVTANGEFTLPSAEYSFTATVSKAIGGTGPAAAAGAAGYLVGIGTTTNTEYIVPAIAANGTVIQCGSVSCFQIGTSFAVATATTSALPLMPSTANSFGTVQLNPFPLNTTLQQFQSVFPPFANISTVTAGTAVEAARFVDFPAGFLNFIGRWVRVRLYFVFTPGSTATLIPSILLYSLYGTTDITLWTVTTAATSGTTQGSGIIEFDMLTTATGSTGTLEAHAKMTYTSATGSEPAALSVIDSVTAASSTIDLTKANTLTFQINSGTANLTNFRVRLASVEVLA